MPIHGLGDYSRTPMPAHFDIEKVIRPNILSLLPYRCARDDYQSGILLDANENALGHSLNASDKPSRYRDLHRYPDPAQMEIKRRIAALRGLPSPKYVFLGVGSDEAIDLLMRVCCTPGRDKVLTTPPTYGMYAVCAQVNDISVINVPLTTEGGSFQLQLDEIKRTVAADPCIKIIFLCSPGNPTGTLLPLSDIRQLLDNPDFSGIVVVDEAYIDFAGENVSAASLVAEYTNLCVMQTLSKSFGLAAIRLGSALAQPPLIQVLTNTKAPYNISTPTAALALQALEPLALAQMREKVARLITERAELARALAPLSRLGLGAPIGGNHANFLIIPVLNRESGVPDNERATKVYKDLAENGGVVIRYRGGELGCQGCVRITIGSEAENKMAVHKLEEVLLKI